MPKHTFQRQYRKLPIPERIQLVEEIWDSIAEDARTLPLTEELKAELDRRWEEREQDPSSSMPWVLLKKELNDGNE